MSNLTQKKRKITDNQGLRYGSCGHHPSRGERCLDGACCNEDNRLRYLQYALQNKIPRRLAGNYTSNRPDHFTDCGSIMCVFCEEESPFNYNEQKKRLQCMECKREISPEAGEYNSKESQVADLERKRAALESALLLCEQKQANETDAEKSKTLRIAMAAARAMIAENQFVIEDPVFFG